MVGGVIIGFARGEDSTLVNVRDTTYGDTCAVRVKEQRITTGEPVQIQVGDKLWWQGPWCMWTPAWVKIASGQGCDKDYDIRLPKIGFSH